MNNLLRDVIKECTKYKKDGKVADYIPELAKADINKFGIALSDGDNIFTAGDFDCKFTMQSVIKPIILLTALIDNGIDNVRKLVGVEATGKPFDAFNYSDQALKVDHINPMINTGAIALCTLINGETFDKKFDRLLEMTRKMSGNNTIGINNSVFLSEKTTGNKNRALAYMLKAYGMIDCDADKVLDCYFKACSVEVNCMDLANIGYIFANHGFNAKTGEQLFDAEFARFVNAVLITSGMYDGSGEFAINVGFPAKSGVGGGIMGVIPAKLGIGVYSPALDNKGNSIAAMKAIEMLSKQLELSIF